MTALLYVSYSSKLTKEEKLSIDKSVLENLLAVRNFVKKVYGKSEVTVISTTLGILILFSGIENIDEIRLGTLPQAPIMKLDSRIDSAKFVLSNVVSQNERTFTQISQIDKTCVEHPKNSLDGLLELRGGNLNPLTKVLFKIVLIWTIGKGSTPTEGFSPGLINPGFGRPGRVGTAPRIAPKLQENPINRNNPDQGDCNQNKKLPNYSETVKFNEGYKAEVGNVQLDHILVKHGHQWGIDDIDLKTTRDANMQIRTRLTPDNREKLRIGIKEIASSSKLELYPNYPISGDMGRAYLCSNTGLFIGIDINNQIRKAYIASENLINYLRTKCT
jgi:hypothetical protein